MKTIIILTRGSADTEFDFWYNGSNLFKEEYSFQKGNKRKLCIISYTKDVQLSLIIVRSQFSAAADEKDTIKSNIVNIINNLITDSNELLILFHSQNDNPIFYNWVQQKKLKAAYSTSDNTDIDIPSNPRNYGSYQLINNSKPLDHLRDSLQEGTGRYDFVKAFEEVWDHFIYHKQDKAFDFMRQCRNEVPKGLELTILSDNGINTNMVCTKGRANGKTINHLFAELKETLSDEYAIKYEALRDGLWEMAGIK